MTRPSPADYAEYRYIRANDVRYLPPNRHAQGRTVKSRIKTFLADGVLALALPMAPGLGPLGSVSESDGGTRLSFPSTDPGRGVHQPNVVVGLCHGRAPLRALRPRGSRPANRWSSRAPPRCSPQPFLRFHISTVLFLAIRIRFVAVPHEFDRNGSTRLVLAQSTLHSARRQRPLGCSP